MSKIFLCFFFIPSLALRQKSKFIGDYLLGKKNGDTLTARLFISCDTFKLIYMVQHDSDVLSPNYTGLWSLENNQVILNSFSERKFSGIFYLRRLKADFYLMQLKLDGNIFTCTPDNNQLLEMKSH